MKIIINDHLKIEEVQKAFNQMFPYLKLMFYSKTHKTGRPSSPKFMVFHNLTLGEIRKLHNSGEILITPKMTVAELEQCFGNEYNLGVQVFRKSGLLWLQTIYTDSWSLEEQNKEGESLSKKIEPDEPEYYQDWD